VVYKFLVIKYKAYYYTLPIHLATTKLKHPIRIPSINEWKITSINTELKEAQPQAVLSMTWSSRKRVVGGDTYEAENMVNMGEATHRVVVIHGGRDFRQWVVAPNWKVHIYSMHKGFYVQNPIIKTAVS
jgi:hypothetical protein